MPLENEKDIQGQNAPYPVEDLTLKQMGTIFGDSGTQRYSGYFFDEQNSEWRDESRIDLVDQMRTDGVVDGVLRAINAPILATNWYIECEDEKIVEFLENNLFEGMERSWKDFVRESMLFLPYGHYVFEKIFKIEKGQVMLRDLSPRIPRSIQNWQIDVNGQKQFGIKQWILTDDPSAPKSNAEIPARKLLILTNDKEGDDVTGRSILRAAYKHYYYKNTLYKIQGISAEKNGMGIPTLYLPEGYGTAEKNKTEDMLANIRTNEKGYLIFPWKKEDGEFELVTPSGNPQGDAIDKSVEHHNRQILLSVLAMFLGLGSSEVGSFALSKDQSSFFLKNVEEKIKYLEAQIEKQVLQDLVKFNFGDNAPKVRLRHNPLGDIDFKEMSDVMKSLTDSGLIDKDPKIKQWTRQTFDLPEIDDEDMEILEKEYEEDKEIDRELKKNPPMPMVNPNQLVKPKVDEKKNLKKNEEYIREHKLLTEQSYNPTREFTIYEEKVDFEFLNESFNKIEVQLEKEMIDVTNIEIDKYVESAGKKVEEKNIAGLSTLMFGGLVAYRKAINKSIAQSYEVGKKTATKEMGVKPVATPQEQEALKNFESQEYSETYVQEIQKTGRDIVKNGIIVGATTVAIKSALKKDLKDRASKMIASTSGIVVGQNINRGRSMVFENSINLISKFQRSEVLDGKTCNMCLSLDRRIIGPTDPMRNLDLVHSFCRGVWIPVFKSEEQPKANPIPKSIESQFNKIGGSPRINGFKQIKRPTNTKESKSAQVEIAKRLNK